MSKRGTILVGNILGGCAVVLVLTVLVIAGRTAYLHQGNYPWMYRADYASFILEGRTRGTHVRLISGQHRYRTFADGQIASIYIKLPDEKVYFLPELPEQVIVDGMRLKQPIPLSEDGVMEYRDMYTFFFFRNGRLECVWLEETDIQIGNQSAGPFFNLPISHSDAKAAFGRPLKTVAEVSY